MMFQPSNPSLSTPRWCLAVALVAWAGGAFGQTSALESSTFFESLDVQVVNVDVFVYGRDGLPVRGLTREDFQLFEEGEPVEITNFAAVDRGPGVVGTGFDRPDRPTDADPPIEGQDVLVVVDQTDLTPLSTHSLLPALEQFVVYRLRSRDRVSVIAYDGRLRFVGRTVGGMQADLRALQALADDPRPSNYVARERVIRDELRVAVENDRVHDREAMAVLQRIRLYAQSRAEDGLQLLRALNGLVDSLGGIDGPKTLLFVSDSLAQNPGQSLFEAWEEKFWAQPETQMTAASMEALDYNLSEPLERLIQHANASRVTIFAMSAESGSSAGLVGADQRSFDEVLRIGGTSTTTSLELDQLRRADLIGTLQHLSNATGGFPLLQASSFGDLLDRVSRDINHHYSLAFSPSGEPDGKTRALEVKVRVPGLKVRHRRSYLAQTSDERMEDQTMTALLLENESNPFGFDLQFGVEEAQPKGRVKVPLVVQVPLSKLVFLPEGAFHVGQISIFVGTRDERGRLSPVQKVPVPIRIPNERLVEALGQVAGYRLTILMKPGPHEVAVGLRDEIGFSQGALRRDYVAGL